MIEKLERYFDFLKSKNLKLQKSDVKSKYDFKVGFDYPVDKNNSTLSSVTYKILNDRLIIELEKCALIQNQTKDIFMLNENAKHEGLRKIYSGQVNFFFDMPFTHLKLIKTPL